MKKRVILVFLAAAFIFSGCDFSLINPKKEEESQTVSEGYGFARGEDDEIVITSSDDVNEIYENYDEYLEDTIYIEGKYESYVFEGAEYHFILKTEEEAPYGFEVRFPGHKLKNGSKAAAKGKIEKYSEDGREVVRLELTELAEIKE